MTLFRRLSWGALALLVLTPAWDQNSNGGNSNVTPVSQIIAGTGVTISPTSGTGAVTINATGGGGSIPSTTDVLTGNGSGGAADSGVSLGLASYTASGCSNSALTGGAVYLKGVTVASGNFKVGAAGSCTIVLTFSSVANNWACWVNDVTGQILFTQTAQSATTCTVTGAAALNDIVTFIGVGT
jgi:hypothetical protein